jgi:hypothetical protein
MKEVGSVLGLTPRTVAFHKYRIMEQLKVKSTAELIQYARQAPYRLKLARAFSGRRQRGHACAGSGGADARL